MEENRQNKKPKGSDSAREILSHAQRGMTMLSKKRPKTMHLFRQLGDQVMQDGALEKKTKELIALGMAIIARCDYCIMLHVQKNKALGLTYEELLDVCEIAIFMGGGPSMTYSAEVERALNEFYLDEEGKPV